MLRSKSSILLLVYDNAWATLAYVPVSANWESTSSGHLKLRLAMPISPLAKPRPSTSATITEAPEVVVAEEQLVAAKTEGIKNTACWHPPKTFLAEVPVWSVSGVRAGYEPVTPAAPAVLQSLGVPPWLRWEELSEVDARRDELVLPNRKTWWSWPETKNEGRISVMSLLTTTQFSMFHYENISRDLKVIMKQWTMLWTYI